jgi:phage shock protein PspC (stress-responsive transcriptional regulator)
MIKAHGELSWIIAACSEVEWVRYLIGFLGALIFVFIAYLIVCAILDFLDDMEDE